VVNAGGVVDIVGSGLYDRFTVKQAVTVKADPGVVAAIDVPVSGTGITVNAASTDLVTLKGLTLHGNGGTGVGFQINSVGRITVEDCFSRNFAYGIVFVPSTASDLKVTGGAFDGSNTALYLASGSSHAAIDHTIVYGEAGNGTVSSNQGAITSATLVTTVTNSLITGGPGGLVQNGVAASSGTTVLENDVISQFGDGAALLVFATAYISSCTFTENFVGVEVLSGTAFTRQNNTITDSNFGTLTPFSAQ
jgi:hypothetical protein